MPNHACPPSLQSVFTLGAAAGGLSAMVLNDLLGRKLSIMFSAVPSVAGYALMAGARAFWMLLLGRTLTGFAGGLTAACIPVRPAACILVRPGGPQVPSQPCGVPVGLQAPPPRSMGMCLQLIQGPLSSCPQLPPLRLPKLPTLFPDSQTSYSIRENLH